MKSKGKSSQEKEKGRFTLNFLPEVEQDIDDAFGWYEIQRIGLGDQFLLAVEAGIEAIRRNPLAFQKQYRNVRRALVRRFPFGIFFVLNDTEITITAIIHLARRPRLWKMRRTK